MRFVLAQECFAVGVFLGSGNVGTASTTASATASTTASGSTSSSGSG